MTNRHKNYFWDAIVSGLNINLHNFDKSPLIIEDSEISRLVKNIDIPSKSKEIRIQCKQDTRESRPEFFIENNLFLLPYTNSSRIIFQGEGYLDIPSIEEKENSDFRSKPSFDLVSSNIGESEMQYVDYSFASGYLQEFTKTSELYLTIRGRKYASFDYKVNGFKISAKGVQTEVDGGYESKDEIVLVEAKNIGVKNEIIRQLYFPYRKWLSETGKNVRPLFFQFDSKERSISFFEYIFKDPIEYTSIELINKVKYFI